MDYINAKGQRADFHALRYTLATNLALAGTPPRVAMEIMRHSDMRLTSKTYTDAGLLPDWDSVANLPSFTDPLVKDSQIDSQDSQIDSQNSVRMSPSLSVPVKKITKLREVETADRQQSTSDLSLPVTTSQEKENWSGRQDLNSEIGADNQELASKDSQNRFSALDTDLQAVISAWDQLPASLRAAVVTIVSSSHSG